MSPGEEGVEGEALGDLGEEPVEEVEVFKKIIFFFFCCLPVMPSRHLGCGSD